MHMGCVVFFFLAVLSFFGKSLYYTESGKVSFILQCMFLISAGNGHEFFPFFKHIPFEVNVASGFQVNGSEVVIVWFIGHKLEVIEILLPLLLCKQMSPWQPLAPPEPLCPQLSPVTPTAPCAGLSL